MSTLKMVLMIGILFALMNEVQVSAMVMNTENKNLHSGLQNNNQVGLPGVAIYESNGTFVVPLDVTRLRVLVVGGGQGGANGPYTGGSSGKTFIRQFNVEPREIIAITVGEGGSAGIFGETSSFGKYLSAGGTGGSGGGQGCSWSMPYQSGAGGSDGLSGQYSSGQGTGAPNGSPGTGQGSYESQLSVFTYSNITPGGGGSGIFSTRAGGGGGGGVLMNGKGPAAPAENGEGPSSGGAGGKGFGAGGGAGGSWASSGGRGANGLVYIEW